MEVNRPPETIAGMVKVTEQEFFKIMGPRNVHPSCSYSKHYSSWRENSGRDEVGRSYPGYINPGDPEAYFVVDSLART